MTKTKTDRQNIDTQAIHAGRQVDPTTGAVVAPLHLSSTFERDVDGGYTDGFNYARDDNPTRRALETCLAALEDGATAVAFPSGTAAINAVLHALGPGSHVLFSQDIYHGTRKLMHEIIEPLGISASYVDFTDLSAVENGMRDNTGMLWLETPSNPLLKIIDLEAVSRLAKSAGARCVADNTFATPVLQQPLHWGFDLVMHSTTKFFGGHHDLTGGAIIAAADDEFSRRVRAFQTKGGVMPAAFDCWLLLRSISTLPLRVRAQSASTLTLAKFLAKHDAIQAVHYPGLEDHPQHQLARRQMDAFGAVISIQVEGSTKQAMRVAGRVKLITRATSLGGVESLIEHRASIEGPDSNTPENLLRLSIGLEHPDDLIADLEHALS